MEFAEEEEAVGNGSGRKLLVDLLLVLLLSCMLLIGDGDGSIVGGRHGHGNVVHQCTTNANMLCMLWGVSGDDRFGGRLIQHTEEQ